jgi:iron(III) transport system substrate-binding protein
MSIVKGARHLENAKRFYDWALSAKGQQFGTAANYFGVPSNRNAASDPRMPDFKRLKLIDYDYAKYGQADERKRLIQRWERDVNGQAR